MTVVAALVVVLAGAYVLALVRVAALERARDRTAPPPPSHVRRIP